MVVGLHENNNKKRRKRILIKFFNTYNTNKFIDFNIRDLLSTK